MNKKGIALLIVCLLVSVTSFAQGRKGLRINEVLVQNDSNLVDDYGQRNAWVELYNSTFSNMEISSVFITNDKNNPTKYPIPRGDVNTEIHPRQHALFFADDKHDRGTFHMNFKLTPGQDNWIGIYDADGITLLDSITVPASLSADHSFARKIDGVGSSVSDWGVRDGSAEHYITPSSNNIIINANAKVQKFRENDGSGVGMAIMAMCVVFSALLVLSLSFNLIGRISSYLAKRNKIIAHGIEPETTTTAEIATIKGDSGEEIAAICMALYQHLNAHDNEDTVLTINKVKRVYSPWSSKIYNMRDIPRH